jgi:hypothetical protein
VTLTAPSEATGISKSTPVASGDGSPSVELPMPLAQAYRVPLDDSWGRQGERAYARKDCRQEGFRGMRMT